MTPKSRVTEIKGYMMDRKNIIFNEGETAERVNNLVAALRKEGVV